MTQASRWIALAIVSVPVFGCREGSEGTQRPDVAADSATISLTDSAGASIVRISDLDALDPPQLMMRLIYSTAAAPSELELYHVVGAVFLPDSSLVVANQGSVELIFLDRHGSVQQRAGREGEGPGEYIQIARVGIGADGRLFVYDRRLRRFTFLDSEGAATGVQSVEQNVELVPLIRLMTGEFLAVAEPRPSLPPGLQRAPLLLVRGDYSAQGADTENVDTLGRWAGKERHVTQGRDRWLRVGFAASALYAGRGQYMAVGTNDSLDVTLYQGPAPLTRIRGGHSPVTVTAREKQAWTELVLETYPEDFRPIQRELLEQSTVRETYPAFGAVRVDPEGRIWIGDYTRLTDRERRWTVLGPDGRPLGAVGLPVFRPELLRLREGSITGYGAVEHETTIPSASHELLDVGAGRLAILRRDELGVEFIEVYEVDLPQ